MIKELTTRSSYMKEKKEALIVLGIAIPLLCYGAFSFEIGGAGSTVKAISVAVSLTFGLLGVIGGLVLFFTKNSLGLLDSKEPKPIIKEETEMSEIKKEKPEPIDLGRTTRKSYILNKEPIIEEETSAHEVTTDNEQPVSESIRLMNEEKKLIGLILQQTDEIQRCQNHLERLKQELTASQTRLKAKGWISTEEGWVID